MVFMSASGTPSELRASLVFDSRPLSVSSAVTRTPWEIWNLILALAIAHQLLPGFPDAEDAFLDGIEVLNRPDEEIIVAYAVTERLRHNLRRVCRGWKEIVDAYAHRFNMNIGSNLEGIVWSPRVHIAAAAPARWLSVRHARKPFSNSIINLEDPSVITFERSNLEALALTGYHVSILPDPYSFRNLRLLSLSITAIEDWGLSGGPVDAFSLISRSWPQLTHNLRIIPSHTINNYFNQVLRLPHLNTLCLTFISKRNSPITANSPLTSTAYPLLSTFSLPRLRTLSLSGKIHRMEKRLPNEINALLRNVGPTLTGVSFELLVGEEVPEEFWDWCPHVSNIQLTLWALMRTIPPPLSQSAHDGARRKLNIILSEPVHFFVERQAPFLPWLFEFFETAPMLWPYISRFTIPVTWRKLPERLHGALVIGQYNERFFNWLDVFRELLVQMQEKGYEFVDREGRGWRATSSKFLWRGWRILTRGL